MVARTVRVGVQSQLEEWQRFYQEVWGIQQNLSKLPLPTRQEGFNWPVVMLKGMTARCIVGKMREHMKVWVWDEGRLDKVESDREPTRDYAIWLRDRIEADEELKNLSANGLKAKGINSITLPERLMLEFFYWWKIKKHLDIENITLCAGSRYPCGYVPCVGWYSLFARRSGQRRLVRSGLGLRLSARSSGSFVTLVPLFFFPSHPLAKARGSFYNIFG